MKVIKDIEKFIEFKKPEIIYTHYFDELNIDHTICSRAVITACRPKPQSTIKQILMFEVLSSTNWYYKKNTFIPNYYEDISQYLAKKIEVLKLYGDEILQRPHTRSLENIENLAKLRGNEVGKKACEGFYIFRFIK